MLLFNKIGACGKKFPNQDHNIAKIRYTLQNPSKNLARYSGCLKKYFFLYQKLTTSPKGILFHKRNPTQTQKGNASLMNQEAKFQKTMMIHAFKNQGYSLIPLEVSRATFPVKHIQTCRIYERPFTKHWVLMWHNILGGN